MSKPCTDCPNQPDQDEKGEPTIPDVIMPEKMPNVGWVIYTGGPPERHLSMMQHTLPKDYTKGRFLPDGSIQYEKGPDGWEPPSPVEGYERDAEDSWLFHPLWKSCQLRMYGTVIKESCECIQVLAVCSHPQIELDDHGEVTFDMCETCTRCSPIQVPLVPKPKPKPIPFRSPGPDGFQSAPAPQR